MTDTFILPSGAILRTAAAEEQCHHTLRGPPLTKPAQEVSIKASQHLNSIPDQIKNLV